MLLQAVAGTVSQHYVAVIAASVGELIYHVATLDAKLLSCYV